MLSGPDQIIACNNVVTWQHDGAVKINMDRSGSDTPISVPGLMMKTAKENPHLPAMKNKDPKTGNEIIWSWSDYLMEVRTVSKAFISLGLGRFESVCILGFNSPEWVISNLAAIFAGGFAAGIYPTNEPEACKFILESSNCRILVVENQKQLDKVWGYRSELPNLKKIVQYSGVPNNAGVISWKDLMTKGKELIDDQLEDRLRRISINNCCTLIYTSGTTGNPKGVMLSHDNITYSGKVLTTTQGFEHGNTRILSYLPLSHIAANLLDIHLCMHVAGTIYFADKDVLKSTMIDNLTWCRPTAFFGVPRVWEKVMEKMLEKAKMVTGIKKTISTKGKKAGLRWHTVGDNGTEFKFYQKLYFSKVKQLLGFDCCDNFASAAAPLDRQTQNYFLSLDIVIIEAFGMSETTGVTSSQTADYFRSGSVGKILPGVVSKLVKSGNEDIDDQFELFIKGRNIMMGYLDREDATKKDMTEDGWLKTGDLAKIDSDGYHYIVGREKDLIITGGGENVAPQPIHESIKQKLPVISQVLLLGDKQKYISTFLTLAVEVDPDTMKPSNKLSGAARDWCKDVAGIEAMTVDDILRGPNPQVMRKIQAGIDAANKESVSRAQVVQKWMILPTDFSIPGGEMGPTMKVKRAFIIKKYQNCIEKIYT